MTAKWAKEYIDELREHPNIQLLHITRGAAVLQELTYEKGMRVIDSLGMKV
jgi:hypothetical protein